MARPIVRRPSLGAMAYVFGRFGNSTFGGGTATVVEIERRVVLEHEWLTKSDSHLAYAISRLTPGTNVLAYCAAAGWRMRRMTGVVVALCAASMPSAAMAAVLTTFFERWTSHPLTAPALKAAMAAAIAIMVGTAWTMVQSSMNHRRVRTALFAGGAFTLALVSGVTPFQVLIAAAVLGSAWSERDR